MSVPSKARPEPVLEFSVFSYERVIKWIHHANPYQSYLKFILLITRLTAVGTFSTTQSGAKLWLQQMKDHWDFSACPLSVPLYFYLNSNEATVLGGGQIFYIEGESHNLILMELIVRLVNPSVPPLSLRSPNGKTLQNLPGKIVSRA